MEAVYHSSSDPEFLRHFTDFKYTAWRLETLQAYDAPAEREAFANFLTNGYLTDDDLAPMHRWVEEVITPARDANKYIGRVHVVEVDEHGAMSDYMRFEYAEYRVSAAAGEDVRIINAAPGQWPQDVCMPGIARDFWLFDSSVLVETHYHPDGSWREGRVYTELTAPAAVVRANLCRDAAIRQSVPFYP